MSYESVDDGLTQFIDELLLNPAQKYTRVQEAFKSSYTADKKRNIFTKVRMDFEADAVLLRYFSDKLNKIEDWFNIIAPDGKTIAELKAELAELRSKKWSEML